MQLVASAVGPDRPGLTAALTGVLAAHGCDVADAQMGVLSGRFAMTLIADAPDDVDVEAIARGLRAVGRDNGLDLVELTALSPTDGPPEPPTHVVTVTGVDHPGIIHAVTRALGELGANVTDLNTHRVTDDGTEPLLAMMLEVATPEEMSSRGLSDALARAADEHEVEVVVEELDDL
jgi:glycine cleavage system transcriptional repressor